MIRLRSGSKSVSTLIAAFVGHIGKADRSRLGARLVEEYSKLIANGHGEKCPWRKTGCDGEGPAS